MNFLSKIQNKLSSFMYGRYGIDQFYKFVMILTGILLLVEIFVGSYILTLVCFALIAYNIFRCFSKNVYKRQAENRKYLKILGKIKSVFKKKGGKHKDTKTHVFLKCPSCKNTLRLPRVKGKHTVRCPCCKGSFDVKI